MKKRHILGIGVAGAAVAFAGITLVSYELSKLMLELAFDRHPPKRKITSAISISGDKKAEEDDDEEIEPVIEQQEDSLFLSYPFEEVSITSFDGLKLVGRWYCPEGAKRAIVLFHGWRSSWLNDFGQMAEFLGNGDNALLFVDQRSQCGSEGDYMTFGLLERFDCLSWANKANELGASELPMYLMGVSMCASTVMMAANLDLPSNVKGIIADCGFTTPQDEWEHISNSNLHIPYLSTIRSMAEMISDTKFEFSQYECSTVDTLKQAKAPLLFIHGTEDTFVPIEMTYRNYQACSTKKTLLVVPGAKHADSYNTDKATYEKALLAFWQENDQPKFAFQLNQCTITSL